MRYYQKVRDEADELLLALGVFLTIYIIILWMCLVA